MIKKMEVGVWWPGKAFLKRWHLMENQGMRSSQVCAETVFLEERTARSNKGSKAEMRLMCLRKRKIAIRLERNNKRIAWRGKDAYIVPGSRRGQVYSECSRKS